MRVGLAKNRLIVGALGVVLSIALGTIPVRAGGISGTLSNFDVFNDNDTSTSSDGAELELEDCHISEVLHMFPSHYVNKSMTEFLEPDGVTVSTRILYTDYNFGGNDLLAPAPSQSTNGHTCVGLPACEHFGFSVQKQPTAVRFFWLDQELNRISSVPLNIPSPTWTYNPPLVVGDPPRMAVAVEVEPAEPEELRPDSVWMKVYKTEIERHVALEELMSGDGDGVVPEEEIEVEVEWELLEGGFEGEPGKQIEAEDEIGQNVVSILRRYEFYEYTGLYSEEHEPMSEYLGEGDPPMGELGPFIVANMVAVNLAVPEPTSVCLALIGAGLFLVVRRR